MTQIPQLNDIARLRSGQFDTIQDLTDYLAVLLEGMSRQQSFKQGVYDEKIVNQGGGTPLSVEDPSIGLKSISMQHLQSLKYTYHGGVGSRLQRRTDVKTEALPGVVIGVEGSGADAVLLVQAVGSTPVMYRDAGTNENVIGNPLDLLGQEGEVYEVRMSGNPFAGDGDAGITLPTVGQTVMISVSRQTEKMTVTTERNKTFEPVVKTIDFAPKAALVNNLCCQDDDDGGGGGGS